MYGYVWYSTCNLAATFLSRSTSFFFAFRIILRNRRTLRHGQLKCGISARWIANTIPIWPRKSKGVPNRVPQVLFFRTPYVARYRCRRRVRMKTSNKYALRDRVPSATNSNNSATKKLELTETFQPPSKFRIPLIGVMRYPITKLVRLQRGIRHRRELSFQGWSRM